MAGLWGRAYQNGIGVDKPLLTLTFAATILTGAALEMGLDRYIAISQARNTGRDPNNRYWYQGVADFEQVNASVLSTTAQAFSQQGSRFAFIATGIIFASGYVMSLWEFRDQWMGKVKKISECASAFAFRRQNRRKRQ
jgi:hypothetical protein